MKKVIVLILSVVICFAALAVITGCAGTSDLEARLAAVEQENKDLKNQLDALKGIGVSTPKIYMIRETATVYESNMPMFTLKYDSKSGTTATFIIKNLGMSNQYRVCDIIDARGGFPDFSSGGNKAMPTNLLLINGQTQFDVLLDENERYVYFMSLATHLTYALFKI